jgi:hypothetical protein
MATLDLLEELLDEAISMIDPRWGAAFGTILELRRLQRRSPDGWARVSYKVLARRAHLADGTMWKLVGTGKSAKGSMWRDWRIVVLGPPRAGRRPQAYALNPLVDEWRGVRWREPDPEIRQLRLDPYLREIREMPKMRVFPRLPSAERTRFAPRLVSAELRTLVPRPGVNNNDLVNSALSGRGTTSDDRGPYSFSHEDQRSSPSEEQQQPTNDFVEELKAAIWTKTGRPTGGRLVPQLARLERSAPVEELVRLIMAAPSDMQPPRIVEHWLPSVLRYGLPAGPAQPDERQLTVQRIEREIDRVRRELEVCEANGWEPDPSLVADRDRWQNELDELTGAMR